MNELFLHDLAVKTRRGLTARVKAGYSGGGRCYGYDIVSKGELQPNTRQVGILHQIFNDFGHNEMSARAIAHKLNAAGEPGPRGGEWTPSTIHGDRRAQDGILHQELYIGVRVFNRRRYRKHPDTGKRSSVLNPPEEWLREPVPHLRIIDQELWDAVQARLAAQAEHPKTLTRKPKRLLFVDHAVADHLRTTPTSWTGSTGSSAGEMGFSCILSYPMGSAALGEAAAGVLIAG